MLAYAHARQSGVVGEILAHVENSPDCDDALARESAWFLATHDDAERESTTSRRRDASEKIFV